MLNSNRVRMIALLNAPLLFVGVLRAQDDSRDLELNPAGGYSAVSDSGDESADFPEGATGAGFSDVEAYPASTTTTVHDASYYVGENAGTPDFYCPTCRKKGLWSKLRDCVDSKMQRLRQAWYYKRHRQKTHIIHRIVPPYEAPNWGYHPTCWRSFPPVGDECPRGSVCGTVVTPYGTGGPVPDGQVPPAPGSETPSLQPVPAVPYDSAGRPGRVPLDISPVEQTSFDFGNQPVTLDPVDEGEESIDAWRPTVEERRTFVP